MNPGLDRSEDELFSTHKMIFLDLSMKSISELLLRQVWFIRD